MPYLLLLISGAATLGWQFLWTEQLGIIFGHESIALIAVTTAFFGGSALGAWFAGFPCVKKINPAKIYIACEFLMAVWGAILVYSLALASSLSVYIIGATPSPVWHGCMTFLFSFLTLLPSTLAMGATLPLVSSLVRKSVKSSAWAGLYAANTLGAMFGIFFTIVVASPLWGFRQTGYLFVACNAVCGILVAMVYWRSDTKSSTLKVQNRSISNLPLLSTLFITGFLGVGYEVFSARVLTGVSENTIFSYASILVIYLFATSLGAMWYQRSNKHGIDSANRLPLLIVIVFVTTCLSSASLWNIEKITDAVMVNFWPFQSALLGRELISSFIVIALPAAAMGALFSHLCELAKYRGSSYELCLSVNAFGSALAPIILCAGLIPFAGLKAVLWSLLLGYGALCIIWTTRRAMAVLSVTAIGIPFVFLPPLQFVDISYGGKLLSYKDGVMASVSVTEDAAHVVRLKINNRVQEGSSASGSLEARLAQIPLALHLSPSRALFLGVGTGYTSQVATAEPAVRVTAVELIPEVLDALPYFAHDEYRKQAISRVNYVTGDARRYIQNTPDHYDVVVGDLFHPARNGAGSLYTVEQFEGVRKRLTHKGIYCQWLALYQMDLDTLKSIVAAFVQVFPNAIALSASNSVDTPVLGLIGRNDDSGISAIEVSRRLNQLLISSPKVHSGLLNADDLIGLVVADANSLKKLSQNALVNTDNRPIVTFWAPWATYKDSYSPRERLVQLLDLISVSPDLVLKDANVTDIQALDRYLNARKAYLKIGANISQEKDPQLILDEVQLKLINILKECPSFNPARSTLINLADAIVNVDPTRSAKIRRQISETH